MLHKMSKKINKKNIISFLFSLIKKINIFLKLTFNIKALEYFFILIKFFSNLFITE